MFVSERIKLYRKVCINDKDRNRTKQHVCNSIDPQQMLDRGMVRLDAIRYGQIRINAFSYVPLPTITDRPSAHAFLTVMKNLPADLPRPEDTIRTVTDITDEIRIVTDRTDRYGTPIRSVRSVRKP